MRKRRPPDDLRGSVEFNEFYTNLDRESETYKRIKNCLDILRQDMCAGDQIPKDRFPKYYVKKYRIENLYRKEIGNCRLTYTIIAENSEIIVCVLEYFPTHKAYNKRFGYNP